MKLVGLVQLVVLEKEPPTIFLGQMVIDLPSRIILSTSEAKGLITHSSDEVLRVKILSLFVLHILVLSSCRRIIGSKIVLVY